MVNNQVNINHSGQWGETCASQPQLWWHLGLDHSLLRGTVLCTARWGAASLTLTMRHQQHSRWLRIMGSNGYNQMQTQWFVGESTASWGTTHVNFTKLEASLGKWPTVRAWGIWSELGRVLWSSTHLDNCIPSSQTQDWRSNTGLHSWRDPGEEMGLADSTTAPHGGGLGDNEKDLPTHLWAVACPDSSIYNSHTSSPTPSGSSLLFRSQLKWHSPPHPLKVLWSLPCSHPPLALPVCSVVPHIQTSSAELVTLSHTYCAYLYGLQEFGFLFVPSIKIWTPWRQGLCFHGVPHSSQKPTGHPTHGRHPPPPNICWIEEGNHFSTEWQERSNKWSSWGWNQACGHCSKQWHQCGRWFISAKCARQKPIPDNVGHVQVSVFTHIFLGVFTSTLLRYIFWTNGLYPEPNHTPSMCRQLISKARWDWTAKLGGRVLCFETGIIRNDHLHIDQGGWRARGEGGLFNKDSASLW